MKRLKLALIAALLLLQAAPAHAFILSPDDTQSVNGDWTYYDTHDINYCQVSNDVNLSGNDNMEKAFHFFVSKGLSALESAAIVGNMYGESGINPQDQAAPGNPQVPVNGYGFGIVQWTFTSRQKPLSDFALSVNQPVNTLAPQLGFAWIELSGAYRSSTLTPLHSAQTVQDAVNIVMLHYEIPAENLRARELVKRTQAAQKALDLYGGSVAGATPTGTTPVSTSSPSGCAGISGNGQNTQFVDGFTVYSQTDPAWKDHPYGTSTIGEAGCGPSAMAMIITALTGASVTPPATADYAGSQPGIYIPGVGSSWSIGPVLAAHWGLHSQFIGASVDKIAAALRAGQLVIAAGQGASPFSTAGHFIVVRAVTADGKFRIGDSGHSNTSSQDWDPQQLVSEMHDGGVYAISK